MIYVAVGVDDRNNRLLGSVLEVEIQANLGGLGRDHRIDDGNSLLTLDDRHVRQILIADLVDAVGDLEEAGDIDELRLAPQAGVDRVRRCLAFLDEVILGRVPDQISGLALDLRGEFMLFCSSSI